MIGGKIIDHRTDNKIVTFRVRENNTTSECYVKAKMDLFAQQLIDDGAQIWWTNSKVYLTIDDIPDCEFEKVGFTY